jgi:DNA-binding transcriptional MerR regulator
MTLTHEQGSCFAAAGGLLVSAAVDSTSGYRYYSPTRLADTQLVDALRQAGRPLGEIGVLLRHPSLRQLDRWARHLEHEAAQSYRALARARLPLAGETPRRPSNDVDGSGDSDEQTAVSQPDRVRAGAREQRGRRRRRRLGGGQPRVRPGRD